MYKRVLRSALIGSAILASSLAAADTGFYVGAGLGQTKFSNTLSQQVQTAYPGGTNYTHVSSGLTDDSDSGYKLFAGYRVLPWLGVELGWQDLGRASSNYVLHSQVPLSNVNVSVDGKYRLDGASLSVFGELAFTPQVSGIVRVGAFNSRLRYSEHGVDGRGTPYSFSHTNDNTDTMAGVGLNWRMTPAWDLRLDYDRYFDIGERFALNETGNGHFDHVDMMSLNLAYRLGR